MIQVIKKSKHFQYKSSEKSIIVNSNNQEIIKITFRTNLFQIQILTEIRRFI
jgi:hypothetical protein